MPEPRCYLLVGADRARKLRRVGQLAQTLRVELLDQHHVHAAEASAEELAALARAHPAASPLRLLVIDDAQRLPRSCAAFLRDHVERLTQVACLVLLVEGRVESSHPLAALSSRAAVESFELADGPPPAQRFALVEAIARGEAGAALRAMQEQLALGKDVTELVGVLVWQLSRWLTVRRGLEAGMSQERLAALNGWSSWQLRRMIDEVADRSTAALQRLLRRCWEADVAIKTGKALPRVALEGLVVESCRSPGGA